MRMSSRCAIALAVFVPAASVLGAELPRQFTLGKYIPDDAWMYMNYADNPEAAFITEAWTPVWDAFQASGITNDVLSLIAGLVPDADRDEFDAKIEKAKTLFGAVKWSDLIAKEFAYSQRVATTMPGYDYFLLARGNSETADANAAAIAALVEELASWTDKVNFKRGESDGVTIWSVTLADDAMGEKEDADRVKKYFGVHLIHKGDMIGLIVGNKALDDVRGLISGKDGAKPIVASERFKSALASVDKMPEDGVIYFDAKHFFNDLGGLMKRVSDDAGHRDEGDAKVLGALRAGLELCNIIDYSITTVETDGRRQFTHEHVRLQPGKDKCPLGRVFCDRKPFKNFDKYVPVDAKGFWVSGFIDLEGLYGIVLDFIKTQVPGGEEHIATYESFLAEHDFDPHRDIFSWLSGEMISVTVPPAVVTPMSSDDSVLLIRVKDAKIAREKIDAVIAWANGLLEGEGQPVMITPADVSVEGFHEITHPMIAMFMRPVIGVMDEWLVFATSAPALEKVLQTASGDAPSILKNERFQAEGLVPTGPVYTVSFKDTTKFGQEMAGAFGMVGMMGGIITAQMPDEAQGPKKAIQRLMTIIMKLGPVLQKIDFYSSEASTTTINGVDIRSERVVTYKPPAPPKPETATVEKVPAGK